MDAGYVTCAVGNRAQFTKVPATSRTVLISL